MESLTRSILLKVFVKKDKNYTNIKTNTIPSTNKSALRKYETRMKKSGD